MAYHEFREFSKDGTEYLDAWTHHPGFILDGEDEKNVHSLLLSAYDDRKNISDVVQLLKGLNVTPKQQFCINVYSSNVTITWADGKKNTLIFIIEYIIKRTDKSFISPVAAVFTDRFQEHKDWKQDIKSEGLSFINYLLLLIQFIKLPTTNF